MFLELEVEPWVINGLILLLVELHHLLAILGCLRGSQMVVLVVVRQLRDYS
jgi:hypothetical protein